MNEHELKLLDNLFEKITFKLDFVANAAWNDQVKVAYMNALHSIMTQAIRNYERSN